jgi:hypothetical protein
MTAKGCASIVRRVMPVRRHYPSHQQWLLTRLRKGGEGFKKFENIHGSIVFVLILSRGGLCFPGPIHFNYKRLCCR